VTTTKAVTKTAIAGSAEKLISPRKRKWHVEQVGRLLTGLIGGTVTVIVEYDDPKDTIEFTCGRLRGDKGRAA
jgi:hypothetical protein